MLPLHSSAWADLSHAYGYASDIPLLLRQLETVQPKERMKDEGERWKECIAHPLFFVALSQFGLWYNSESAIAAAMDQL